MELTIPLGADPETRTLVQVVYLGGTWMGDRERKAATNKVCIMNQTIPVDDWSLLP